MKKTWIILLTGMLVIGLIPGAMANPKIDSNAQAKNEKQITVDIDGAQAADAAINQILTNNGNQDNHNAGIGGNADAISGNIAGLTQNAGNDNLLSGCNSGDWSGVGGSAHSKNKAKITDSMNVGVNQSAKSKGGDSNGDSGDGGSGCNNGPSSNTGVQDQTSNANAIGGEGNSGDVNQNNDVRQDALAEIDVHQTLTQPVDIREFQIAAAHEDSTIDFTIPVSTFNNTDSLITIPIENGNNASEPGNKIN